MNKIGILYICTGNYDVFWRDFYKSAEEKFIPTIEKEYFVFTDAQEIYAEENANVHKIKQENLGWPQNTLFRFEIFKKSKKYWELCDYLFFFNANMIVESEVGEDILTEDKLIVVRHPGYWNKCSKEFPYDRNPKSNAYIEMGNGRDYVMGSFNGGPTKVFEKMINELSEKTLYDYNNGIIPLWHDESYLNKYILDNPYKILNPGYAYPQGWYRFPFVCKLMLRDKVICAGRVFIKQKGWTCWQQIYYYVHYFICMIKKH